MEVSTALQEMLDWVKYSEEQHSSQQPLFETGDEVNSQHQTHTVSFSPCIHFITKMSIPLQSLVEIRLKQEFEYCNIDTLPVGTRWFLYLA